MTENVSENLCEVGKMQKVDANASQTRRQPINLGMSLMHAVACWVEGATVQQP